MSDVLMAMAMRITVFCSVVPLLTYRVPERPASHPMGQ